MALFARVAALFRRRAPCLIPQGECQAEEMFELINQEEGVQATQEYISELIDRFNAQATTQRAKDTTLLCDWQIVSDGGKTVEDLDAKETTEFLHFLNHQFDGDEGSLVF